MVAARVTQQQQREQSPPASTFKWQQAENFFEAKTLFRPISLVQQIVAQRRGTQERCLPPPLHPHTPCPWQTQREVFVKDNLTL